MADGMMLGWKRECADADELLRLMFPDQQPQDFRTDGGWINLPRVRERREASSPKPLTDRRLDELWAEFSAAGYRGTLWEFVNVARFVEQAVMRTHGVEEDGNA